MTASTAPPGRRWATAALAVATALLLALTRAPSRSAALGVTGVALAALAAVLGILAAARPAWRWTAPAGLAALVAAMAVPASPQAVLAGLPAPLAAACAVVLALRLYPREDEASPHVGAERGRGAAILRMLPMLAGVAFLVLAPLALRQFAPARLADSRELAGAAGTLVAAALAACALAGVALAKAAPALLRRRSLPASEPRPAEADEAPWEGTA